MERLWLWTILSACASVSLAALPDAWLGAEVTETERCSVHAMRSGEQNAMHGMGSNALSKQSTTDIDRLRFLRQQRGNVEKAITSMADHLSWREESVHGAEAIKSKYRQEFEGSILNDEFIWLGLSKDNDCPTMVIRSQLHDGGDYHDDPYYFVKYLVYLLELGKEEWGIGPERGFCMIVDRTDAVRRSTGEVMRDKLDFSVIPNLIELFRVIYSTLNEQYPKLLVRAQVVPTSWFYSTCWGLVSKLVDTSISSKFDVIQEREIAERLSHQFPKDIVPVRFGGTADEFVRYAFDKKNKNSVAEQTNSTMDTPQAMSMSMPMPKADHHEHAPSHEENSSSKTEQVDSSDDVSFAALMRIVEGDGFGS